MRNTIGEVYQALGLHKQAEEMHTAALALQRRSGGESVAMAVSMNDLALALRDQRKLDEAVKVQESALDMQRRLLGGRNLDVANSLNNLALLLRRQGDLDGSEKRQLEALEIQKELQMQSPGDDKPALAVATSLNNLALLILSRGRGRLPEAETNLQQALAIQRKLLPKEHPAIAMTLDNLAVVLREQPGRLPEAEACGLQALGMKKKDFGLADTRVLASLRNTEEILKREKKYDEIEQLFDGILTGDFITNTESAGYLQERAEFLARRGRWKDSAADFSRLIALDPEDRRVYYPLLPLLAQNGQIEEYRVDRSQFLARFRQHERSPRPPGGWPGTACCCRLSGAELETAGRLAETALTAGNTDRNLQYFQFVRGLADYRRGLFEAAAGRLQKILETTEPSSELRVETGMVLAMARQQLKEPSEARATLADGVSLAGAKLPKPDSGELGPGWQDVLAAHILMREARNLIEGGASTKPDGQ